MNDAAIDELVLHHGIEVARKLPEGWNWLWNAPKEHYFVDARSLCGRWMLLSVPKELSPTSTRPCAACLKKLQKRQAKYEGNASAADVPNLPAGS